MHRPTRRPLLVLVGVGLLIGALVTPALGGDLDPDTQFAVARPNHGAIEQIARLRSSGNHAAADLIEAMIERPNAEWFTQGTPKSVRQDVRNEVNRAAAKGTVAVLVAYNIPFRDCAQFSAGGATSVAAYEAWIDGFAAGIGDREAIVILEPDGLGIIPWYDPYAGADGDTLEWCQPAEADRATASADRFAMMNYAVDALKSDPNARVYLDGTHSAWLGVGDIAHRLLQAGVERADGFYLNASNYQFSTNSVQYGTWISSCLATASTPEQFVGCPNQYWNGGPLPAKIAELLGEWTGVALSPYGEWSDASDDPALNTSGINLRYASAQPTTHFVVDTSRNGLGPWLPPVEHPAGDAQDWCNPPDRGLGLRPTADTGNALVDAYLWIKTPGESDGQCNRWAAPGSPDPVRGIQDPAAGQWFPKQALELAQLAVPPLD
jgi:endoglucanase